MKKSALRMVSLLLAILLLAGCGATEEDHEVKKVHRVEKTEPKQETPLPEEPEQEEMPQDMLSQVFEFTSA